MKCKCIITSTCSCSDVIIDTAGGICLSCPVPCFYQIIGKRTIVNVKFQSYCIGTTACINEVIIYILLFFILLICLFHVNCLHAVTKVSVNVPLLMVSFSLTVSEQPPALIK